MVCAADPFRPASLTVALICSVPVALLVRVVEATPARLVDTVGTNMPEGAEKSTTIPSATGALFTVALARTATGVPAVKTLSCAVGSVIWSATATAGGGGTGALLEPLPPPQEASSAVKGKAHRRR